MQKQNADAMTDKKMKRYKFWVWVWLILTAAAYINAVIDIKRIWE